MPNFGFATVDVVPSMRGFGSAMAAQVDTSSLKAGKSGGAKAGGSFLATFGGGVAKVGGIAAATVGVVASALGATALKKGLDRALDIQDAQKKLEGLGHSQAGVAKIMDNALSSVKGTAFGLGDAATVAASAVAAGVKPGKELTGYLKLTADTATIAGTSLGDMGSILNKATASGTVYSDTLNQLSDRGVPVFTYLQKAYHVSADELTKMVKKGEVDSGTLSRVLQENLGGSALRSGETARGAYANIGAALGRLGVAFTGPAVAAAPSLFQQIAASTDSFTAAIKPLAELVAGALASAMTVLQAKLAAVDWDAFSAKVHGVAAAVTSFLAGFRAPPNLIDGQGILQKAAPLEGIAGIGQRIRAAWETLSGVFTGIGTAIGGLLSGGGIASLGSLGTTFEQVRAVVTPLWPLMVQVGQAVGQVAGSFGALIAAGVPLLPPILNLLAGALGFVADHEQLFAAALPALVAGLLFLKLASQRTLFTSRVLSAMQLAQTPATLAATLARLDLARAALAAARGNDAGAGATAGGVLATIRQTIATVAGKAALLAVSAATKVAAAVQWALNAVLSANPVGLIVLGITALVAGLVFFFTQTKAGQTVWANFTRFLGEAWANAAAGVTATLRGIGAVVVAVFAVIASTVASRVAAVRAVVATAVAVIASTIKATTGAWRTIIAGAWSTIRGAVASGVAVVRSVVSSALALVKAVFSGNWAAIPHLLTAAAGKVIAAVRGSGALGVLSGLASGLAGAFGNPGAILIDAGRKIIGGLLAGLKAAVGNVKDFLHDLTAKIPDWKGPAEKDATLLAPAGQLLMTSLARGLEASSNGTQKPKDGLALRTLSVHTKDVGKFAQDGLVQGFTGSSDDVASAGRSLFEKIKSAFDSLKADASSAAKTYKSAVKAIKSDSRDLAILKSRLADVDPQSKTAATQRKSIANSIAKKQAELKSDRSTAKSAKATVSADRGTGLLDSQTQAAVLRHISADNAALAALAVQRDQISADLKDAQSALVEAVKVRDDFASNVASSVVALGDITGAFSKALTANSDAAKTAGDNVKSFQDKVESLSEKLTDLEADAPKLGADRQTILDKIAAQLTISGTSDASKRQSALDKIDGLNDDLREADKKIADYNADHADIASQISAAQAGADAAAKFTSVDPVVAITDNLRDQIAATGTFTSTLAQLKSMGLDDTTYRQLVAQGVEGGLASAQALVQSGAGTVQSVASLQQQLGAAAATLGQQTSVVLYQAGVDAAQGVVNGLQSQLANVTGAIGFVEGDLALRLKALGVNTKALSVQAGADIADGFVDGMVSEAHELRTTTSKLGSSLVKAIKKELGIHSPSRVLHDVGEETAGDAIAAVAIPAPEVRPEDSFLGRRRAAMEAARATAETAAAAAPAMRFDALSADEVADGVARRVRRAAYRATPRHVTPAA